MEGRSSWVRLLPWLLLTGMLAGCPDDRASVPPEDAPSPPPGATKESDGGAGGRKVVVAVSGMMKSKSGAT